MADESLPLQYNDTHAAFLSDQNGIRNLYVAHFDTILVSTDTRVFFKDSIIINPEYDLTVYEKQGLIDTILYEDIIQLKTENYPISNYGKNILEYDIALQDNSMMSLVYDEGKYLFYKEAIDLHPIQAKKSLNKTIYRKTMERRSQKDKTAFSKSNLERLKNRNKRKKAAIPPPNQNEQTPTEENNNIDENTQTDDKDVEGNDKSLVDDFFRK